MDPRNKELRISPSSAEGGVVAQRLDPPQHRGPMFWIATSVNKTGCQQGHFSCPEYVCLALNKMLFRRHIRSSWRRRQSNSLFLEVCRLTRCTTLSLSVKNKISLLAKESPHIRTPRTMGKSSRKAMFLWVQSLGHLLYAISYQTRYRSPMIEQHGCKI